MQPAPWASGDANHGTLFDWSEFTYNDAGLWLNSSQVDMFAVPHTVTVTGASGTRRTGDLVANGRQNTIDQIAAQPGWANTVVKRADGTVLRVLAPGKAAGAGLMSTTYLDSYIASAWNAYTAKTLTVVPFGDQPSIRYFGRTSGTVMRFTNSSGQQVASFNRPSSADVWGCDGALHAPNDQVVGPLARTLCAALNRGTLGTVDTQPSTDASAFYRSSPTNQYARIVHANMADGKAYAFAFDDVGAFESLVHDGSPSAAGLIIQPFTGGGTTNPPPPTGSGSALTNANGMCLDNSAQSTANGNKIQIWGCNGTVAQKWTYVQAGTTLRVQGKCLDIAGGGTANGTKVQLYDCNGTGAQVWIARDGGYYNPAVQPLPGQPRALDDARHAGPHLGLQRRQRAEVALGLDPALEAQLSPRFVGGDSCGVREVHRPAAGQHRDPHLGGDPRVLEDLGRQARRLGSEEQDVVRAVGQVRVVLRRVGGEGEHPPRHRGQQVLQRRVHHHVREVVVVQPRPAQLGLRQVEPQRLHQVQGRPRPGRQTDGAAGVAGDAGLEERDVQHPAILRIAW